MGHFLRINMRKRRDGRRAAAHPALTRKLRLMAKTGG